jgi:hypothetical protein
MTIFFISEMTRDCYWRIKRVGEACINTQKQPLVRKKLTFFITDVRYLLVVCFVISIHIIITFVYSAVISTSTQKNPNLCFLVYGI